MPETVSPVGRSGLNAHSAAPRSTTYLRVTAWSLLAILSLTLLAYCLAIYLVRPSYFLSWQTLKHVEIVQQGTHAVPKFDRRILALDQQPVQLQGFILPLGLGDSHDHFILTAIPPTCPFCLPGGADQSIEVHASKPIRFGYESIVLGGKLSLLKNDAMGWYYRLDGASQQASPSALHDYLLNMRYQIALLLDDLAQG